MPEIRVDFAGGNDGRGWRVLDRYQRGVPGSEPQVIILGTTPSEAEEVSVLLSYAPDMLRIIREWADTFGELMSDGDNERFLREVREILGDCKEIEVVAH